MRNIGVLFKFCVIYLRLRTLFNRMRSRWTALSLSSAINSPRCQKAGEKLSTSKGKIVDVQRNRKLEISSAPTQRSRGNKVIERRLIKKLLDNIHGVKIRSKVARDQTTKVEGAYS